MTQRKRRVTRVFVAHDLGGDTLPLDQDEAHYLAHVLRLQRGDGLVAFNGRGEERHAVVNALQRRGALLDLREAHAPLAESPLDLTLVQALPKADAMDLVVQKATELGVRCIRPAYAEFSVVRIDGDRLDRRADHWQRIARSACEQCGRHTPPSIATPMALPDLLHALPDRGTRLAFDLGAEQPFPSESRPEGGVIIAIGPEGGFGPTDWRALDAAGFIRVTLGPRVLRAETAAITACAIAQSRWGDL